MPVFCRHNRFEANCPICSREKAASRPKPTPARRSSSSSSAPRTASGSRRSSTAIRTRKLPRDVEDGYRSELVPGVKATSDAERLARSLATAAARLKYPGPYEVVAAEPDADEAIWLAFLIAVAAPEDPAALTALLDDAPTWASGDAPRIGPAGARTVEAYRDWAARAGGQSAAFTGEAAWTPARRFSRLFERLALPGLGRVARFELLVTLGAAGLFDLEAGSLHLGGEDATTQSAKRALVSGDVVLLERRALALAQAARVPLAALDGGLRAWNARPSSQREVPESELPALAGVRSALGL